MEQDLLKYFIPEPIYLIRNEQSVVENETTLDTLTKANESTTISEESTTVCVNPLPTLGTNLKNCVVLVASDDEVLGQKEKTFLLKIMRAVKRQEDDILIVNCKKATQDHIESLLTSHNPRHLLDFDSGKLALSAALPYYEVKQQKGMSLVKAHALSRIEQELTLKKALWKVLQEIFL